MLEIKDAVAVVTGGGSGIGEAFAKYWVQRGGKVVIADVIQENLSRVKEEIVKLGGKVESTLCDVTNEEDNHRLAALAMEAFGAINLVLPCAGIIKDGLLLSTDRETGKVNRKMSLGQFRSVLGDCRGNLSRYRHRSPHRVLHRGFTYP